MKGELEKTEGLTVEYQLAEDAEKSRAGRGMAVRLGLRAAGFVVNSLASLVRWGWKELLKEEKKTGEEEEK